MAKFRGITPHIILMRGTCSIRMPAAFFVVIVGSLRFDSFLLTSPAYLRDGTTFPTRRSRYSKLPDKVGK